MTVLTTLAINGNRQGVNRRSKPLWDSDSLPGTRIKGRQYCATPRVLAQVKQLQTAMDSAKQDLRLQLGAFPIANRTRLMLGNEQLVCESFAEHVQPDQYGRDDNRVRPIYPYRLNWM